MGVGGLQAAMGSYLRIHAAGMFEERPSEDTFVDAEPLRNSRQVPNRLHGELRDVELSCRIQADLTVGDESSAADALLELRELHMSLGDGNRRTEIN